MEEYRDFSIQAGDVDGFGPVNYSTDPTITGYTEVDENGDVHNVMSGGEYADVADARQTVYDAFRDRDPESEEEEDSDVERSPQVIRTEFDGGRVVHEVNGIVTGDVRQEDDIHGGLSF